MTSVPAFPPKAALILPVPAASCPSTARAVLMHHKVYLSVQSFFSRLLICKLQEGEAGAALELCILTAPGVGELNQKKAEMHLTLLAIKPHFADVAYSEYLG